MKRRRRGALRRRYGRSISKIDLLHTLIRVLDKQEAEKLAAVAERSARVPDASGVLAAIRHGEHTWGRLHAYFAEETWPQLGRTLTALQRSEQIYRDAHLDFRLGARPGARPWRVQ